ncbi:penicillin-binding protein 3 [Salmonella enterica subsp. enterica]|uniref:Penicillin-binding protein 3 n=1 Tax=Salmonella enterica I TaxID=59201 RepID=A0A447MY07_SALET|nr:penicillin-binding protein 3 [Salmonella enterica subsp. enterica]
MRKDRYGRVIEDISSTDSQAAHNLALSIDERLQALVLPRTEQRGGV